MKSTTTENDIASPHSGLPKVKLQSMIDERLGKNVKQAADLVVEYMERFGETPKRVRTQDYPIFLHIAKRRLDPEGLGYLKDRPDLLEALTKLTLKTQAVVFSTGTVKLLKAIGGKVATDEMPIVLLRPSDIRRCFDLKSGTIIPPEKQEPPKIPAVTVNQELVMLKRIDKKSAVRFRRHCEATKIVAHEMAAEVFDALVDGDLDDCLKKRRAKKGK
jgi:hypothetical protein